ncbi:MAG TPA: isoamylase early set domain-containing protein [Planctomycetota bacterium]|nr:isoamylase early set domain-containing protein [Planctomycetota bacterium]
MEQVKVGSTHSTSRRIPFSVNAPRAEKVVVTGDFTDWSRDGVPLRRASNGQWGTVLSLSPGEHQYRLIIDGEWCDDPMAKKQVPNEFGGCNCVLEVRDR